MGFLSNLLKVLTPPGGTVSIEKLQSQLTSPETKIRQGAIEQLGDLPTAETVRLLADVIRHDEEFTVRRKAIAAFERIGQRGDKGDIDLVGALNAALHDSDSHVRSSAEAALKQMGA